MEFSDKVRVFLTQHGMEPERFSLADGTAAFISEMELGLAGKPSSLDMIPTYLGFGTVEPGRRAAVIDAGGTNFRASSVYFAPGGAVIERCERSPMPGSAERASWQEFEDFAAAQIEPMLEGAEGIGFCFSYRAEVTQERDGRVIAMSKAVQLAGELEVVGCLFVGGEGVVVCPGFADEEKGGVGGVGEKAVADAALFLL